MHLKTGRTKRSEGIEQRAGETVAKRGYRSVYLSLKIREIIRVARVPSSVSRCIDLN